MSEKPHKGTLNDWREVPLPYEVGEVCLGYIITGTFQGHERFDGYYGRTSYVVKREENEIETRNNRYTLGTPAA